MRARPITCSLIALFASGGPVAWSIEPDASAARVARYYDDGLETALMKIRTGVAVVEACKKRFRSSCSKRHRQAADKAQYTILYLDALSLFPQRLTNNPSAALKKYEDVVAALDAVNTDIVRAARDYDRALFDRYRATLETCPPENVAQYRESLHALEQLDARAYGGAVPGGEEISLRASAASAALSGDDCPATRDFGELLMTMMSAKLEPWRRSADVLPDADAARGIANEFLFEVATELEVTVNPDSRGTFDAIAQRMHDSEPRAPKKSGFSLSW
jgi:hypothetical protein